MLIFGPVTVKYNGSELGKTYGGVALRLLLSSLAAPTVDGGYFHEEVATGGEGSLNMFQWGEDVTLESSTTLRDWGELVLEAERYKVTMPQAKLMWPANFDFGLNDQRPFSVRFVFKRSSDGTLIKIEEVS